MGEITEYHNIINDRRRTNEERQTNKKEIEQ